MSPDSSLSRDLSFKLAFAEIQLSCSRNRGLLYLPPILSEFQYLLCSLITLMIVSKQLKMRAKKGDQSQMAMCKSYRHFYNTGKYDFSLVCSAVCVKSINQSTSITNQPNNQPINQSINQSINQPINQSINQSTNQSNNQSIQLCVNLLTSVV